MFFISILHYNNFVHTYNEKTRYHANLKSNNMKIEIYKKN